MAASLIRWLESFDLAKQLLILVAVFDPLGAALGYALHPVLGVEPLLGVSIGVSGASVVLGAWILRHVLTNESDAASAT